MSRSPTTSFLSTKCFAKESPIHGKGIFASEQFSEGELIAIWGGNIIEHADLQDVNNKDTFVRSAVAVFEGYSIGKLISDETLEECDLMNHSCDPNAGVKGQILLLARRNISGGEEICFDYETTECEECIGMPFKCYCGSNKCRRVIDGKAWRRKQFQENNKGYFSWYIEERIRRRNPN